MKRPAVLALTVAALSGVLFAAPSAAQPVSSAQLIVASAPTEDSVTGTLTAYQRVGTQWRAVIGPTPATFGELGVGVSQDDVFRTPIGRFPLDQAFGREPNPGTRMPFFQATDEDWWDEDVDSPTYNTHVRSVDKPSGDAENLYDSGPIYDYAVNIAHNPQRIPGRSAGIFLHVTDGDPTWGCVAIDRDQMRTVLQWLDPAQHPQIEIGVGLGAPA
ncbi:L,D-transpeptidase family protein [Mycobacterium sp. WMMD1722]|uniref:L,D-transpeptidase family protein n=1 Tax=Mycobacterium sp. WMMD1722 TaxID=3404117 RepID=UPI003BF4BB67